MRAMNLYFFDTRDDGVLVSDDVGLEFPDLATVKVQAAKSLAELAADVLPGCDRRCLGVDVRDEAGLPVMVTDLVFEARIVADPDGWSEIQQAG
jgi:hypothetical protein